MQKKSKYQQKLRGNRPSNAPWGFTLGSLRKTTVTIYTTGKQIKMINLKNGHTAKFIKGNSAPELETSTLTL